ncbi:MAG: amino acid permease, partial [Acidobacteriota bacterium]
MSLWATKSIATLRADAEAAEGTTLKRALGPFNLVTMGIGAVIGAGIFVLTGQAAALYAGPAVPISMAVVGVACAFAGLCYAEMASTVPVAGSAYTYVYATLGEFLAWIVGWDLVLEYAAGAAGVSVGWSANLVALLGLFGIHLPDTLANSPTAWCTAAQVGTMAAPACLHSGFNFTGAVVNLPAVCIVALISTILVIGILGSLIVCTLLYMIVSAVLTGMVSYEDLNQPAP